MTVISTLKWTGSARIGEALSFRAASVRVNDGINRAHRIGQIRDVHIYRFISQHTVEEAMLRKANQKRSLDDLVIQRGEFDWRSLFRGTGGDTITRVLEDFADDEDARAARIAAQEAGELEGADAADFGEDAGAGHPHAARGRLLAPHRRPPPGDAPRQRRPLQSRPLDRAL